MTIVVQVKQLVIPLCYYSDGVLNEGHDDQEAADGGQVAGGRAPVSAFGSAKDQPKINQDKRGKCDSWNTHGLIGSLTVSRRSSILLVCWRIASSGLWADLSSAGPPKGLGAAMP